MLWQWFAVGMSGSTNRVIRGIAVTAGLAVALHLRDAHNLSNYYAIPIGIGVYLVVRISLGVAMVAWRQKSRAIQPTFPKT